VLIVVSVYVVGQFYFNNEYEMTPARRTTPTPAATSPDIQEEADSTSTTQTETDTDSSDSLNTSDSAVEAEDPDLKSDVVANINVEVVTSERVSPFGFGPYLKYRMAFHHI
jgi:hypothetical protein